MAALSGLALVAANMLAGKYINVQTGTSYTFVADDAGCGITFDNGSAVSVTVPANADVAYPVGTMLACVGLGAGTVTFAGDTGVTVNGADLTLDQYEMGLLWQLATDTWLFVKWGGGGGSGALVLLEQHTASTSASLNFTTCISSTYDEYLIEILNIVPVTDGANLWMRLSTDGGATYDSGNNYAGSYFRYSVAGTATTGAAPGTPTGKIELDGRGGVDNSSNWGLCGELRLIGPGSAIYKRVDGKTSCLEATVGGVIVPALVSAAYMSATAVDAFQFLCSSGNISSGTIRVYGIAKS